MHMQILVVRSIISLRSILALLRLKRVLCKGCAVTWKHICKCKVNVIDT